MATLSLGLTNSKSPVSVDFPFGKTFLICRMKLVSYVHVSEVSCSLPLRQGTQFLNPRFEISVLQAWLYVPERQESRVSRWSAQQLTIVRH